MNAAQATVVRAFGLGTGAWEYRMRWYGEEESVARACAAEVGTSKGKGKE